MKRLDNWRRQLYLAWLWRKAWSKKPGSLVRFLNYTVRINDGPNFCVLYKDIFFHHIYHFAAQPAAPLILDCGSNIGISILYFKHIYPQARIIGFEPDPAVFIYLAENITQNRLTEVKLIQAALANQEGALTFYSDVKYESSLAKFIPGGVPKGWVKCGVPCIRLRNYLTEPVDFLKMNIEGAEYEVLMDSEDRLRSVREMVVEYHYTPELPQTLHKILELLNRQNFLYVVSDFGLDTYSGAQVPLRADPAIRYYRQIYACRI